MVTQVRARMGSASGVVGMHERWGYPRRRCAPSTHCARVVDAHRRRGLDFYGQIPLWPPKYAHGKPVQAALQGCTNVEGNPRRRCAPSTHCARVVDAHRRRGLDFYGQIPLWPPQSAHEWPVQAARLRCTNAGGTPAVGLHPPHPVFASWTLTIGVVWTSTASYFYGHPRPRTNGPCKRRGRDAQMLGGHSSSVCTLHTRWSRRGRTP